MVGALSARVLDKAANAIERATGLDKVSSPVAEALRKARPRGWVTDVLSGTPLGHPFHPLLVTVPIGTWTGAIVLDLLRNRSGASTLVGLGVLGAAPTVLTGMSDWADTKGAEGRVGFVHGAANLALVAVYGASWLARRRGHHLTGALLHVPGLGLLAFSGWLGGHLSYARGVGVDTTTFQHETEEWTPVAPATEILYGNLRRATVAGEGVIVTRAPDESVVAYADRCVHRSGPLSEGRVVDGCVECPLHGSQFDLADGHVVAGPATRPQPRYEVRLDAGQVLLRRVGIE